MKNIKYSILAIVFIWVATFTSCKDDSESTPSETDQQLITLQNNGTNWVLGSDGVTKDGFDVTSQFAGFKLNIGNKTYTTENGLSPVWEPSGNWDFIDNNPSLILRDGDTQIVVSVTSNALTLTFTADAVPTGGRVESVSGEYQFHLVSE
ncbi:hypothetical protein [Fulvivirga lutea]|uniref:Lipocalin-like domain-containing protein n=1 Tax=Fulvivirga lutea TaxID=2810512 RepID=A0A974WIN0_9BACT|nr:hypothetical protein [Fulvivirga lutea]QSE99253.1 hypothetical protein JR347_09235 [Fulvivirga lutea]